MIVPLVAFAARTAPRRLQSLGAAVHASSAGLSVVVSTVSVANTGAAAAAFGEFLKSLRLSDLDSTLVPNPISKHTIDSNTTRWASLGVKRFMVILRWVFRRAKHKGEDGS
jgi:hypothetical protein